MEKGLSDMSDSTTDLLGLAADIQNNTSRTCKGKGKEKTIQTSPRTSNNIRPHALARVRWWQTDLSSWDTKTFLAWSPSLFSPECDRIPPTHITPSTLGHQQRDAVSNGHVIISISTIIATGITPWAGSKDDTNSWRRYCKGRAFLHSIWLQYRKMDHFCLRAQCVFL
jgi:hypothetical protein